MLDGSLDVVYDGGLIGVNGQFSVIIGTGVVCRYRVAVVTVCSWSVSGPVSHFRSFVLSCG